MLPFVTGVALALRDLNTEPQEVPMDYRFELYVDQKGEHRWRLVAVRGGKTVADGAEGYASRSNLRRAVNRLLENAGDIGFADVVVVDR